MKSELLNDVLKKNLNIIFCGMAAGVLSVKVSGYYADTNNKFWSILYKSGFTEHKIKSCNYEEILKNRLGLTDLVKNQSGVDNSIKSTDKDVKFLEEKIKSYKPKILAFNGKRPASIFLQVPIKKLQWGLQKEKCEDTKIWVLPSTSGLNGRWVIDEHEKIWRNLYQHIKQL